MSDSPIFVDGLIIKERENAPDWVLCSLSVKVEELIPFLQQHVSNGWVNIEVKRSKNGKPYAQLDTWKPTQGDSAKQGMAQAQQAAQPAPAEDFKEDWDVPF